MKKIVLLFVCLFCYSIVCAEVNSKLFHIERSKNANIVMYEANLDKDGKFNIETPVNGYWILYAENTDKTEKLSAFDKKAYGFKTKYNKESDNFDFTLKAVEDKKMTILMVNGVPKVKILINNIESYLNKVYIQSKDNALGIPKVSFYTLYGVTVNTDTPIEEKIIVK